MQDFGNFLANYWALIVATIMTIISTIIALIRKKPQVITNFWTELLAEVGTHVPGLVVAAEKNGGTSFDKSTYVVNTALDIAKAINNGHELTDLQAAQVIRLVRQQMELVLYAPTKKGGLGREEIVQGCDAKSS